MVVSVMTCALHFCLMMLACSPPLYKQLIWSLVYNISPSIPLGRTDTFS
jgi:hypothetical protein